MSFRKVEGYNPKWANNQGFINAMVERLYKQSEIRLQEYVSTLTEDQKNKARSHLQTVLKIEGARNDRS